MTTSGSVGRVRSLRVVLAVTATAAATTLLLSGCRASTEAAGDDTTAVVLQPIAGSDRFTVTLTQDAVDRLGIRTAMVRAVSGAGAGVAAGVSKSVPYAAVVYDSDGSTWTYTVVEGTSYVRAALKIASIEGDTAYLTSGPPTGTPVVVVGAPELLGAEYQIAGEE
jgi:hypothetical protein